MSHSFWEVSLATHMVEGWNIIPLKGEIYKKKTFCTVGICSRCSQEPTFKDSTQVGAEL